MMYPILKFVVNISIRIFFKSVVVTNKQLLPKDGPLIVVANHPSTFMDPVVIAAVLKQEVYFLAKGSLFTSPFKRWALNKMHVIPIYRQQDDPSKTNQNNKIFEKCEEFLTNKGTLMIFPEGTSINERRLRKIKTGTARIALGAEAENNYQLNLQIVTIGLNYSDPRRFRSELLINVDEPIKVADYAALHQTKGFEAVKALTEKIRQQLEQNIIITNNDDDDELVKNIETIYRNQLVEELELSENIKEEEFLVTKTIVDALHFFSAQKPQAVKELKVKISSYINTLEQLQLKDDLFASEGKKRTVFWATLKVIIYTVLGFPLYIYGLINNYIPYKIPSIAAAAISEHDEYRGPIMMTTGMFMFPIFYALQCWLVYYFFESGWISLVYLLSLPISGFFALHFWGRLITTRNYFKLFSLFYKRNTLVNQLIVQRTTLLNTLDKAKNNYLAHLQKTT